MVNMEMSHLRDGCYQSDLSWKVKRGAIRLVTRYNVRAF